jgi:transglutaminase-like putative cysteine protease
VKDGSHLKKASKNTIKHDGDTGFRLRFTEAVPRKSGWPADTAGRLLLALLLFTGLSGTIWHGLGLDSLRTAAVAQVVFGAALCLLLCTVTKRRTAVYIALLIALAVYAILARNYISDGWCMVFNHIFTGFEHRLGRIFPFYQVTVPEESVPLRSALFLVFPTALLAVLSARAASVRTAWRFLFLPLMVLIWMGAAVFRLPFAGMPLVLLGFAMAGMRARTVMLGNQAADRGKMLPPLLFVSALIIAVLAVPPALLFGNGVWDAAAARQSAGDWIHSVRYHDWAPAMPEGDFSGLGSFTPEKTPALSVTMSLPRSTYLRGYVGDAYTGNGWTELRPDTLGKYAELFSWLHSCGFYGQRQFSMLADVLGQGPGTEKDIGISVKNLGACSAYVYTPYGLAAISGEVAPDKNMIGDRNIEAGGLRGQRQYSYASSSHQTRLYNDLFDGLYYAKNAREPSAISYLKLENAYREFVYDVYLDVPDPAKNSIEKLLAPFGIPQNGRVSFQDAQSIVLSSLLGNAIYNETPGKADPGEDFVSHFLEKSKEGYSVHFASAAALIFRYLGVPARYAEGYLITDQDVWGMQDGLPFEVDETHAHAWVEIYRDGVGFIPFEVSSPYMMPMGESTSALSGGSGQSGPKEEPPEEPEPPESPQKPVPLILVMQALLAALLFLVLALLGFLCLRRYLAKRRLKKLFEDPDNAEAVCWMVSYAVRLMEHMGLKRHNGSLLSLVPDVERMMGPYLAVKYTDAVETQREAMFSGKPVPDERREKVHAFMDEVLNKLKESSGAMKKLRLKWILCVY